MIIFCVAEKTPEDDQLLIIKKKTSLITSKHVFLYHPVLRPELVTAVFVNMKCWVSVITEIVLTSLDTPEVRMVMVVMITIAVDYLHSVVSSTQLTHSSSCSYSSPEPGQSHGEIIELRLRQSLRTLELFRLSAAQNNSLSLWLLRYFSSSQTTTLDNLLSQLHNASSSSIFSEVSFILYK